MADVTDGERVARLHQVGSHGVAHLARALFGYGISGTWAPMDSCAVGGLSPLYESDAGFCIGHATSSGASPVSHCKWHL